MISKMVRSGFTLLEVMVALLIMSVLTLLTAQSYKAAIDNRTFVTKELSRDAQLADTLRIMRADIGTAFHYQNVFCKMDNDLLAAPTSPAAAAPAGAAGASGASGISGAQQPPPQTAAPAAGGTPAPCPVDVTGFIGESQSLYFTSLSNVRTLRDSQESDQAKIGYYLKSCKSHSSKTATQCLYRSLSPLLDVKIDTPGAETLLLENVEEFKMRYLGPQHEDYLESWKTGDNSSDDVTKVNFPYAVEITLTILDKGNPKDKPTTQTVLAPIYFVNNPKSPQSGTNGSPTPAPSAGSGGQALPPPHH
jgi:prepilin-type N-terminal cleavage/methylation domain-containing protein